MNELTLKDVSRVIAGWNIMYPGKKDPSEVAYLAARFHKSLAPVFSKEAFEIAAELVESEQEFFPTIAHMKKMRTAAIDQIQRNRGEQQKALPEYTDNLTEEEVANNLKRVKIMCDQINGIITAEEALRLQEEITTYARQ